MSHQLLPAHVDAPPAQSARGGLSAAYGPSEVVLKGPTHTPDGEPIHWQQGVQVWGENVAGWRTVHDGDVGSTDQKVVYGAQHDPDQNPTTYDDISPYAGRPFMIQTSVRGPRPSRGTDLHAQLRRRVQNRLDAITWKAIGRELWTGDLTTQDPYEIVGGEVPWANPTADSGATFANPHFTVGDADTVSPGPLPAMEALGAVYEALGDTVAGTGLIHVPRRVMPAISWSLEPVDDGVMRVHGGGAYVICAEGYQRYGPGMDSDDDIAAGSSAWIYGTGPIQVWLDDGIDVFDRPVEVVNIANNQVQMWAQRPALALFDPATLLACPVATPS